MHKRMLIGAAILMFAGFVWASTEPWKTKPYQQWDKTDLATVLFNSPWCKKIVVDVHWKRNSPSGGQVTPPTDDTTTELREHLEQQKGGMPDTSPPNATMTTAAAAGSASSQTSFFIRWYSSRVIREALAREAMLNGKISEAEAEKLLATPVTDYEVMVFGPDMTPFQGLTEDELKSDATLEGKQSKQAVAPASVRINKTPDGRTSSVAFLFSKKTSGGQDVASAEEKGLDFACKLKNLDLRNTFEPRKMVDEKGEDF